ncbi:MAG: RNA methyltransferase [Sphaerochaetaceae bacterium]|nr:RNA methyltransferase [Sphaerochaetaceae bacterium]
MANTEKNTNLDRIEIVLVDTQDGANIGSACRAMKAMGITHLTLVTSQTYDENRVKTLALHAFDIYENRKEFRTLREALEGTVMSFATTRRHGKERKTSYILPDELVHFINSAGEGRIAIVFGCEAFGLSDEQVHECSRAVTIPTSELFPSLNLSQAVQIICYELYQKLKKYPNQGHSVSTERAASAADACISALSSFGYFKSPEEVEYTRDFLRDHISRASMTESEVARFEKIFIKSGAIIAHRN